MSVGNPRGALLALLADCKDDPFEDGLRLILADWLEENGDELDQARAELIRSQVHYERLPADDPTRDGYGRRARWLQQRHGKAWLGPLAGWDPAGASRRGLLGLSLTVMSLRSRSLLQLAESETWAWVEDVQVTNADEGDIDRLGTCALLGRLSAVGFAHNQIGPAGGQALGRMPWMGRVARLDLSFTALGDAGLLRLLRSDHVQGLRELTLTCAGLGTEAGGLLARADGAGRLRRLTLSGNPVGDLGVIGLTRHAPLAELHALHLRGAGVRSAGAEALALSGSLPALRVLDLRDNHIGPRGAAALASSPHLDGLELLVLFGNPVGAEGAARLVERFGHRVQVSPIGA